MDGDFDENGHLDGGQTHGSLSVADPMPIQIELTVGSNKITITEEALTFEGPMKDDAEGMAKVFIHLVEAQWGEYLRRERAHD